MKKTNRATQTGRLGGVLALGLAVWCAGLGMSLPAMAGCRFVKFATLPVDVQQASPRIEGSVNGLPIQVLIDTGAARTSLTRSIAERAQLPLSHSGRGHIGVGGESQDYNARVKEFRFGPVRWERMNLSVIWQVGQGMDVEALLGADVLFENDIELLLAEREIRFFKPPDCGKTAHLAYWDPQAVVVPMLPDAVWDRRAVIEVQLNGQPVRALIDTGATASAIDLRAARKAGLAPQAPVPGPSAPPSAAGYVVGIGERQVPMTKVQVARLEIGDEVIANARLDVFDMWAGAQEDSNNPRTAEWLANAPQMILGADFLAAHRVLIAPSQRRVYLTHLGGPAFGPRAAAPASPAAKPD